MTSRTVVVVLALASSGCTERVPFNFKLQDVGTRQALCAPVSVRLDVLNLGKPRALLDGTPAYREIEGKGSSENLEVKDLGDCSYQVLLPGSLRDDRALLVSVEKDGFVPYQIDLGPKDLLRREEMKTELLSRPIPMIHRTTPPSPSPK